MPILLGRKPLAKLWTSDGILHLYEDALVEKRWPLRDKPHPIEGLNAHVDGAGMQMRSITLGNVAYLTITGPGVAVTRELKGRTQIRRGVKFAAQVNAHQQLHQP